MVSKLEYENISSATEINAVPDTFERGLIGCMLNVTPQETAKIASQASDETFSSPRNQFAYKILRDGALAQASVGLETAAAIIQQSPGSLEFFNNLEDVKDYLSLCVETAEPHFSWKEYVKQHHLAYVRRRLMTAFDEAQISALRAANAEEAAADAIAKVIETAGDIRRNSMRDSYCISSAAERYLELYQSDEGLATPYPQEQLNFNGGYRQKQVVIVAANTGGRKSFTVLDWIIDGAKNHGKRGRIYSLEMDEIDILERAVAMENDLDLDDVVMRKFPPEEMIDMIEELAQLDISIVDSRISPGRIIADLAAMPEDERPHNVVVDHLDLFAWKDGNETNALKAALAAFKDAAKQFNVTFFLVSQFRRPRNDDEAKYPHIGMLKGGSAIEQIADLIVFIQTELDRGSYGDDEITYFDVKKARQGKPKKRKFRVNFLKLRFR